MAKKTVTAEQYVCNNCSKVVLALKDEPPEGFGGTVYAISGTGGRNAQWWACRQECIEGAILHALIEED